MKHIVIYHGFHPDQERLYNGEHIYRIIGTRCQAGETEPKYWQVENDVWIKKIGKDKFVSDWTNEERWGRVMEVVKDNEGNTVSENLLGFVILRVDRKNGLL